MWKWLVDLFKTEETAFGVVIPNEWIVTSVGQSIKDGTWFCEMLWAKKYLDTGEDVVVFTEEHETCKLAIEHAIFLIGKREYKSYEQTILKRN